MAKKKTAKKEAPVTADAEIVEEYDATRYTPWVPGNMPVGGKSNSTEQLNDHPTEHNHSAEAISDIVDRFADLRLYVPAANTCGIDGFLQVDGAASVGNGKLLTFNGNWENCRIYNTSSGTREFMYIGNSSTGAGINLYGDSDSSTPGNVLFYAGSRTVGRWDGPTGEFIAYRDAKVQGDLQVDGQIKAKNGTKSAPGYSFTSNTKTGMFRQDDGGKSVISLTADSTTVMNIGTAGVTFPGVHSKTTASPANVFVAADGQLFRSTATRTPDVDTADLTRLESVIETLTARIEQLEARLETGTTDA